MPNFRVGACRQIRDGATLSVWLDLWVVGMANFHPRPRLEGSFLNMEDRVNCLVSPITLR